MIFGFIFTATFMPLNLSAAHEFEHTDPGDGTIGDEDPVGPSVRGINCQEFETGLILVDAFLEGASFGNLGQVISTGTSSPEGFIGLVNLLESQGDMDIPDDAEATDLLKALAQCKSVDNNKPLMVLLGELTRN